MTHDGGTQVHVYAHTYCVQNTCSSEEIEITSTVQFKVSVERSFLFFPTTVHVNCFFFFNNSVPLTNLSSDVNGIQSKTPR